MPLNSSAYSNAQLDPDGGVACHAGGNWRGWRGRRRRLLRLQFLGLLQGVIDQAHSAWFALGRSGVFWRLDVMAAIPQSVEVGDFFDRAANVPIIHLVGVADEGGQQRFVADIVDDAGDSLAETMERPQCSRGKERPAAGAREGQTVLDVMNGVLECEGTEL